MKNRKMEQKEMYMSFGLVQQVGLTWLFTNEIRDTQKIPSKITNVLLYQFRRSNSLNIETKFSNRLFAERDRGLEIWDIPSLGRLLVHYASRCSGIVVSRRLLRSVMKKSWIPQNLRDWLDIFTESCVSFVNRHALIYVDMEKPDLHCIHDAQTAKMFSFYSSQDSR